MKRIQLRSIPDNRFPPGTPEFAANLLSWAEAIRQVIRKPLDQQKGADIDEMRRGIRVLDAVDAAEKNNGLLELEDADWEELKKKTDAMQWAFVDKRIIEFVDDVTNASDEARASAEPRVNGQLAPAGQLT